MWRLKIKDKILWEILLSLWTIISGLKFSGYESLSMMNSSIKFHPLVHIIELFISSYLMAKTRHFHAIQSTHHITHPASRGTHPGGSGIRRYGSNYFIYDSCGLLTQNKFEEKSYCHLARWGSTKVRPLKKFFRSVLRKTSTVDSTWMINMFFR